MPTPARLTLICVVVFGFATPEMKALDIKLAEGSAGGSFKSPGQIPSEFYLSPTYADANLLPTAPLMAGHAFTPADAGTTWSLNAGNDVGFDDFVAKLTDGINERVGMRAKWGLNGGGVFPFENQFWTFGPGILGPDLLGYTVTGIDFSLVNLTFLRDTVEFDATIAVYGQRVPEGSIHALPILSVLLASMLLIAQMRGRRSLRLLR